MPSVLIRNVPATTLAALKARAKRRHRTLEAELRTILQHAASFHPVDARALAARIRRRFAGRRFSDSTALIAADRRR